MTLLRALAAAALAVLAVSAFGRYGLAPVAAALFLALGLLRAPWWTTGIALAAPVFEWIEYRRDPWVSDTIDDEWGAAALALAFLTLPLIVVFALGRLGGYAVRARRPTP